MRTGPIAARKQFGGHIADTKVGDRLALVEYKHGELEMKNGRPKKVPAMVPRGAENGAKRLALEGYESAPDCTENLESKDAGTLDQTGSSGIVLRQNQAERQGFEPWDELPHLRFSRPASDCPNEQSGNDLGHSHSGRCTRCCTPPHAEPLSDDVAAIVAAWPELPDHIRQTILTLVKTAAGPGRSNSHD